MDRVLSDTKSDFVAAVELQARRLRWDADALQAVVARKVATRTPAWFQRVEGRREAELAKMRVCFQSPEYNAARTAFVHKSPVDSTPLHLAYVRARLSLSLSLSLSAHPHTFHLPVPPA